MIRFFPAPAFWRIASILIVSAALGLPSIAQAASTKATKQAKEAAEKRAEDKKKATAGATNLGSYGDWGAYVGGAATAKVCFVLSQPKDRLPKGLTRDPAYIFISFRPAQGIKNEIAVTTGYGIKPGAEPLATLGATKFGMVAKDSNAFCATPPRRASLLNWPNAQAP